MKKNTINDEIRFGNNGNYIKIIKYSFNPKGKYKTLIISPNFKVGLSFNSINSFVSGVFYKIFLIWDYILGLIINFKIIDIINGIIVKTGKDIYVF